MKTILYKDLKYYIFIDPLSEDKYTVKMSKDNITFLKNNKENMNLTISIKDLEDCIAYSTILGIEYEPRTFIIVENEEDNNIVEHYETIDNSSVIKNITITDLNDMLIADIEINLTTDEISIINYKECKVNIK